MKISSTVTMLFFILKMLHFLKTYNHSKPQDVHWIELILYNLTSSHGRHAGITDEN